MLTRTSFLKVLIGVTVLTTLLKTFPFIQMRTTVEYSNGLFVAVKTTLCMVWGFRLWFTAFRFH